MSGIPCVVRCWQVSPSVTQVSAGGLAPVNGTVFVLSSIRAPVDGVPATAQQHLCWLPAHSARYRVAILAQTAAGNVLGLSTYFGGGHRGLMHLLTQQFGDANPLWGGELFLRNDAASEGCGLLDSANHTSGHFSFRKVPNELEPLSVLLKSGTPLPFAVSSAVTLHPFNPTTQHLDVALNLPGGKNVRHTIYNINGSLDVFVSALADGVSLLDPNQMEIIRRNLTRYAENGKADFLRHVVRQVMEDYAEHAQVLAPLLDVAQLYTMDDATLEAAARQVQAALAVYRPYVGSEPPECLGTYDYFLVQ